MSRVIFNHYVESHMNICISKIEPLLKVLETISGVLHLDVTVNPESNMTIISKNKRFHTEVTNSVYTQFKHLCLSITDKEIEEFLMTIFNEHIKGDDDDCVKFIKETYDDFRDKCFNNSLFCVLYVAQKYGLIISDEFKVIVYIASSTDTTRNSKKIMRHVFTIVKDKGILTHQTAITVPTSKDINNIISKKHK